MNLPDITFLYAYPLDTTRRHLFEARELGPYPSMEKVHEVMEHWQNVWSETNKDNRIIEKLREVTHRVPHRALECFVFGAGLNPMSTPFLLPITVPSGELRSDELFLQTVIHELLHIFVDTDTEEYWELVREKYASESVVTRNHIIIFAMLAKIYQDLFGSVPPDFAKQDPTDGYAQAMAIVKEAGYERILADYDGLIR